MGDVKEIKATAELKLPEKVDENVGKACRDLSQTVKKVVSPASKIAELYLIKAPCALFAPLAAYLKGKSYEIACKYLPFQNQIEMRKELSQIKMAQFVLENLVDKEQKGEELPPKIEDTDILCAIQNAASKTTDEDFIKFWARLYTEEACKPNTVSKKTVNLCKDLNRDIINILEQEIFSFCDEHGFYFGNYDEHIVAISIAKDYGFLKTCEQAIASDYIDHFSHHRIGKFCVQLFPGYAYGLPFNHKMLTHASLEIFRCLKFENSVNVWECIRQLEEVSTTFQIAKPYKNLIKYKIPIPHKFFVTLGDKIVYPEDMKEKKLNDVIKETFDNIEYTEEAASFRSPTPGYITIFFDESPQNA